MNRILTRRDFLRISTQTGLGLSALALPGCRHSEPALLSPSGLGGYKALVCVFLYGGNDGYNMLVPLTQEKYDSYAKARLDLAIPKDQLLPVNGTAADGAAYGLHPQCPELRELFNSGRAALLANVGNLSFPTSKSDYAAGRVPPRLFSHNDQTDQWQTAHPDVLDASGWAGRMADVLSGANRGAELPLNLSLAGTNLMQRGVQTGSFSFSAGGAQLLTALGAGDDANGQLRAAFDRLRSLDPAQVFEQTYSDTLGRGIRLNELLAGELKKAPELVTAFPADNALASQLKMVAQLISIRSALSLQRQIFFVALGGFDTHDAQSTSQPVLMQRLSQALRAFHDATVELGVAERVTSFTASDFGRSLTVNGKGTDHGWGGHQWIIGGAVNGGGIYGMPPSLVPDGADDSEGGRFIPQTSVDEYGATLARWFGIGEADLRYVFPNLGRFATSNLGFML